MVVLQASAPLAHKLRTLHLFGLQVPQAQRILCLQRMLRNLIYRQARYLRQRLHLKSVLRLCTPLPTLMGTHKDQQQHFQAACHSTAMDPSQSFLPVPQILTMMPSLVHVRRELIHGMKSMPQLQSLPSSVSTQWPRVTCTALPRGVSHRPQPS